MKLKFSKNLWIKNLWLKNVQAYFRPIEHLFALNLPYKEPLKPVTEVRGSFMWLLLHCRMVEQFSLYDWFQAVDTFL